jgi:uncharacterized protein DUF3606
MERRPLHAVDPPLGNIAMQRIKHPPIRNKINLADPAQARAWTRRLNISADALKAVVGKAGNSVAAVTKEVELQRAAQRTSPVPPPHSLPAEDETAAPG